MLASRVRQSIQGAGPTAFTLADDASATQSRTIVTAYGSGSTRPGIFTIIDTAAAQWAVVEGYATASSPDTFTLTRTIRNSQGNANNLTWSTTNTKTIFVGECADLVALLCQCPTTGGTASAYTVTYGPSPLALVSNAVARFVPHVTNTGAATLTINGLAPIPLQRPDGTALQAGDIVQGRVTEVVFYGAAAARLLTPPFRGALLRRTTASGADFADNNVASTAIWSGVDYDTNGFWSGGSRITIPSGLGIRRVRLSAQVGLPVAITATGYLIIRRGGATFPEPRCPAPAGTQTLWASTPPLQVQDGDYLEVLVQQTSGAARAFSTAWDLHWFSIEEVK
ncbi:hypothetical protein [Azospirillum brasilense]|uniref:hypothetical protein n=1 Tax=Azospirillum brasilense TaxID=192 RepID=UPI000E6A583F|nr:hypothetical protein [Azospirillum brasilense]NUB24319.1 hypothetical protein [Azospirillum brasilense]NUB34109.1 hypothetical protein [Azospirillum brasilense]RIW01001.1 hypothetical protein D2T81_19520 [Azospirillum brasilense]